MANRAPSPPTSLRVNGVAELAEQRTENITGTVPVSAIIDDPNSGQTVRLVVRYSAEKNFATYAETLSGWSRQGTRPTLYMRGLKQNTLYYGRAYTQDRAGKFSASYNSFTFWTNRLPLGPVLLAPLDNLAVPRDQPLVFSWTPNDPDIPENPPSSGFRLEYRTAGTPLTPPGAWIGIQVLSAATTYTLPANTLPGGVTVEYRIRTRDRKAQWGGWSETRSLFVLGATIPPALVGPVGAKVINIEVPQVFEWRFADPSPGAVQGSAAMRYRVVGTTEWFTRLVSGADTTEEVPPNTLASGYQYEWQAQTTRSTGANPTSDWSQIGTFWTIRTPGALATDPLPKGAELRGTLGVGVTKVFLADRGGKYVRGEITRFTDVSWGRERDAMSTCTVTITGMDEEQKQLLRDAHTWRNELVVYRDDSRVWEGPITLIQQQRSKVVIQAHDVMAYAYRRILRQGYNDSYRIVGGVQRGLLPVVDRAAILLTNGLGYSEPNVLPYLTVIRSGLDAKQSRVVPDYAKSVYDEVDSLAQDAGLDYTTAGRRIYLWDTHNRVGILPQLSSEHFSEELIISEYGLQGSNYYAVTDGQGLWGGAYPLGKTEANWADDYGPVEMLVSGYGDTAPDEATDEVLTEAARLAQVAALSEQARRGIGSRFPFPRALRVPDNSALMPNSNIPIEHLIPGVWIPLVIEDIVTPLRQMQKLDAISVNVSASEGSQIETVGVKMSPAPDSADDPDANATESGESGVN